MRVQFSLGVAATLVASAASAFAGTNGFINPAFRGQPGAQFTGWENFTVGIGEPGNGGDLAGSYNGARLYQTAAGALVLGSGNIYNGSEKSSFDIRYTGSEPAALVYLQLRTLGTELDYGSVKLIAAGESGPVTLTTTYSELDRVAFGPPPPAPGSGSAVSTLWQWDLSGLGAEYFVISFQAAEINLSLDSATLDVQAIPEPGVGALLAAGSLLLVVRRRQR